MAMTGVFVADAVTADETFPAFVRRMHLAVVPLAVLGPAGPAGKGVGAVQRIDPVTPKGLFAWATAHQVALATSWLITTDASLVNLAETVGLHGVVVLDGDLPTQDGTIRIAHAGSLADATRVMIPRQGGCWHDHR